MNMLAIQNSLYKRFVDLYFLFCKQVVYSLDLMCLRCWYVIRQQEAVLTI